MVTIQVGTYFRVYARRSFTFPADILIPSVHHVHIGGRASQVAQITLEVRQLYHIFYFFQDGFFASAYDELPLMRRNSTESATTEAAPVDIDGELYHVVCRNAFPFIFGMRQTSIRQVERVI